MDASVQVQTVLYRNPFRDVQRFVRAAAAAVRHARAAGLIDDAVLVIGDCSPDPVLEDQEQEALAAEAVALGFRECSYKFFDANLGSGGGENACSEGATAEYILVQNPDTYTAPTMLTELLRVLAGPSVGIAEPRQIPLEHPKAYDPATGNTSWASGACMLVRRSVFESVCGFDAEHFPLYCDDVDFSWRVRLAGHRVVHVPSALVFHDKRTDTDGRVVPAAREVYSGTLARLLLTERYGRPDIANSTVAHIEANGSHDQREALAEYRARSDSGAVPHLLSDGERVAEFVQGEYAVHRW